jgi:hypothetical protein
MRFYFQRQGSGLAAPGRSSFRLAGSLQARAPVEAKSAPAGPSSDLPRSRFVHLPRGRPVTESFQREQAKSRDLRILGSLDVPPVRRASQNPNLTRFGLLFARKDSVTGLPVRHCSSARTLPSTAPPHVAAEPAIDISKPMSTSPSRTTYKPSAPVRPQGDSPNVWLIATSFSRPPERSDVPGASFAERLSRSVQPDLPPARHSPRQAARVNKKPPDRRYPRTNEPRQG